MIVVTLPTSTDLQLNDGGLELADKSRASILSGRQEWRRCTVWVRCVAVLCVVAAECVHLAQTSFIRVVSVACGRDDAMGETTKDETGPLVSMAKLT